MQFIDLKKQQDQIRNKIDKRISNVLDHGKYIMGPEINELESHLAKFTNVKHCISCSSGTDALLIPLMARGIGPGDAVVTTPFTYIATAEVIKFVGATPVFVDIQPNTFNIDPHKIKNSIEIAEAKGLKVKAIIPVDLFGLPANYNQIYDNCSDKNLFIIEDAAQGFGGMINGKKLVPLGLLVQHHFSQLNH